MKIHTPLRPAVASLVLAGAALSTVTLCRGLPDGSLPVPPSTRTDRHLTATRTHAFTVRLPLANAFTLFEPVGEKTWAEGFDPVFATPESARLGPDSVFTLETSRHGTKLQTIWLITKYDRPAGLIEYRAIYPGMRIARITVQCRTVRESETGVEVTYHYTGLSEEGDRYIAAMTEEKFGPYIEEWAAAIRAYLARGTPASP